MPQPHNSGGAATCCRPACGKTGTRSVPSSLFRGAKAKVCKACYTWMRRHFQVEPNGKHVRCAEAGILPRCATMLRDFEDAGVLPASIVIRSYPRLVLASSHRKVASMPATPPPSPSPAPRRSSRRRAAKTRAMRRSYASRGYGLGRSPSSGSLASLSDMDDSDHDMHAGHRHVRHATTPPVRAGDDGLHSRVSSSASALPPPRTTDGTRGGWLEIGFDELRDDGSAAGSPLPGGLGLPCDPPADAAHDADGDVDMSSPLATPRGASHIHRSHRSHSKALVMADDGLALLASPGPTRPTASRMLDTTAIASAGGSSPCVAGWEFLAEDGSRFDDDFDVDALESSISWPAFSPTGEDTGAGPTATTDTHDGDHDMSEAGGTQDFGWAFLASAQPCGSPTATAATLFPQQLSRSAPSGSSASLRARLAAHSQPLAADGGQRTAASIRNHGTARRDDDDLGGNPRRPSNILLPRYSAAGHSAAAAAHAGAGHMHGLSASSPSGSSAYAQSVMRAANASVGCSKIGIRSAAVPIPTGTRSTSSMVHVSSTDSLMAWAQRAPASPGFGISKAALARGTSGSSLVTGSLGPVPRPSSPAATGRGSDFSVVGIGFSFAHAGVGTGMRSAGLGLTRRNTFGPVSMATGASPRPGPAPAAVPSVVQ